MTSRTEPAVNVAIGAALRKRNPGWRRSLQAEQVHAFEAARSQPDLIVIGPAPIVIETEFVPGNKVEEEALSRLEETVVESGQQVEHVLACRLPLWLKTTEEELNAALSKASIEYCILSGTKQDPIRWPEKGWLTGSIDNLADCIETVRLTERLVTQSTETLDVAISQATYWVMFLSNPDSRVRGRLGKLLNQEASEQTVRLAMTILVNAFTFHVAIQDEHNLPDFSELKNGGDVLLPSRLITCWQHVLTDINYWPIFKIAIDIIKSMGTRISVEVFKKIEPASTRLNSIGASSIHDLSGRMLQQLITDREFLATFYTLPSSAALLAELAVSQLDVNWNDHQEYSALQIADFSCGTGTLLTAAYQAVLRRYRRSGGNDAKLHPKMMSNSLIAADIMPAATHLTASQLSSTNPSVTFEKTCVYTMPYGFQPERSSRPISLGSLDLLASEHSSSLFGTGIVPVQGSKEDAEVFAVEVKSKSLDLVIMNPPFVRPTNHESASVPVPSFAGFQTSDDEQRAMSQTLKAIRKKIPFHVGNGSAGLASDFIDLAHAKVKPGGVVAFVLPSTVLRGASWSKFRRLVDRFYHDVTVVSIASIGQSSNSFSADTGIAEVLLVATRNIVGAEHQSQSVCYISLFSRPAALLPSLEIAKCIRTIADEDGSGSLRVGDITVGRYFHSSLDDAACAGTRSLDVVRSLTGLQRGQFRLPRCSTESMIPLVPLARLGKSGPVHRLIGQLTTNSPRQRGAFRILPIDGIPTFPVLWKHNTAREKSITVQPDSYGEVREGQESAATQIWATATMIHFNLDFRLNSQALAACLTPERTIGGRAWPSYMLDSPRWEKILALWCNTTLGLMLHWWAGSRQQQGRSILTVTSLPSYMVLDCTSLSDTQLRACSEMFGSFAQKEFLPANEAYKDQSRIDLDQAFMIDVLGFSGQEMDALSTLRDQWCFEPSVHGGKSTRILIDLGESV